MWEGEGKGCIVGPKVPNYCACKTIGNSCLHSCNTVFLTHTHVHAACRFAGTIRTNAVLDRESKSYYWLTIMAADHGTVPRSSIAEVYVRVDDVNDNKPRTELPVYYPEVLENSEEGVPVLQLEVIISTAMVSLRLAISSGALCCRCSTHRFKHKNAIQWQLAMV